MDKKEFKKIPYDSLCLAVICTEIQKFIGSKVQRIVQPSRDLIVIQFYGGKERGESSLLFDIGAETCRIHFVTTSSAAPQKPPSFCEVCRARFESGVLISVEQIENDRILKLEFERVGIRHFLIAEIMGKHSNLILIEKSERIVGAMKWVPSTHSQRPILSNSFYELPPVIRPNNKLTSPFYESHFSSCDEVCTREFLLKQKGRGFLIRGQGAYPLPLNTLLHTGQVETKATLSIALEIFYQSFIQSSRSSQLKSQLIRALQIRESSFRHAIIELQEAKLNSSRSQDFQEKGELLLTHQPMFEEGTKVVQLQKLSGEFVSIEVDAEKTAIENAQILFERSKKAKKLGPVVEEKIKQCQFRLDEISDLRRLIDSADEIQLNKLVQKEPIKNLLRINSADQKVTHERSKTKYRIREIEGPGGFIVQYGENSESNDYLTLRCAKPNDYWLHVRGSTSAHVVISTQRHPERVSRDVLIFAAKLAVRNSTSKHSKIVAVDYTLCKYVRKPKGSKVGTVNYSHEKTLHIEAD